MIKIELEIFHKLQQNLEIERAENERMCKENAYLREQIACACNALRDSFLCCGNRIKDNIGWVRKLEAVLIASNEDIDRHTMRQSVQAARVRRI